MNWDELLSSKGYIYIGKCCGNWGKFVKKENYVNGKVVDASKIIRVRSDKFKVNTGIRHLRDLESYLNAQG